MGALRKQTEECVRVKAWSVHARFVALVPPMKGARVGLTVPEAHAQRRHMGSQRLGRRLRLLCTAMVSFLQDHPGSAALP